MSLRSERKLDRIATPWTTSRSRDGFAAPQALPQGPKVLLGRLGPASWHWDGEEKLKPDWTRQAQVLSTRPSGQSLSARRQRQLQQE
eukprot:Skav207333  [mRNA]  locus=scaffold3027:296701:298674:- [translate_table: standard]